MQIDVDIGSSSVARRVIGLVMGYVTSLVVDLAILIEVCAFFFIIIFKDKFFSYGINFSCSFHIDFRFIRNKESIRMFFFFFFFYVVGWDAVIFEDQGCLFFHAFFFLGLDWVYVMACIWCLIQNYSLYLYA